MRDANYSRRRFLRTLAATLPAGSVLLQSELRAQELKRLEESDPTAQALLYVHDAADVDTSNPLAARFAPDQNCANCAQIQGAEGEEWRPCAIFLDATVSPPAPKLVNAKGWCNVWAPMP